MSKSLSEICDGLSGRISRPPNDPIRLSSWEPCPLCHSMYLEVHEDPIYKPEVVCMECGITLQGETVFEIKLKWNKRRTPQKPIDEHAAAMSEVARLREILAVTPCIDFGGCSIEQIDGKWHAKNQFKWHYKNGRCVDYPTASDAFTALKADPDAWFEIDTPFETMNPQGGERDND